MKKEKLKVFTAFSGYDSQCLALKRLHEMYPDFDYELVGWSEIDSYAIQAHNILFPEAADLNHGDISSVDWSQVPDFDLFTYSSPCFVAGTKVKTKEGYKNIEDIKIGDEVISHTGNFRKVIDTISHQYNGKFLVEVSGSERNRVQYQRKQVDAPYYKIRCTPNHQFYVFEKNSDAPVWKRISDLCSGDCLYELRRYSTETNIEDVTDSDDVYRLWYEPEHYELIKIDKPITVYNLTVDIDNSYNVYDVIVHNCQDFSLAGKQRGGEEGSGTRSSLLWECKRCIESKRPKYLLLENVTTLVSKKFFPLFMKWVDTVRSFGYESFWATLNAKYFGVPQNRDRLFLVSIRKDTPDEVINYNFPNPQEITRYAEDLLETRGTVDEKYFVDQDKVREWAQENRQRIAEYISERNGIPMEELEIVPDDVVINDDNIDDAEETEPEIQIEEEKLHTDNNMPRKKKQESFFDEPVTTVQEETKVEEIKETESSEDFAEAEDARWNSANTEKKSKKEKKIKPIREYLTEEEKALRGDDVCILRIPTPTCSDGTAPTLMATGYANADYKNFYSVGHFPKLGVLEVWRHVVKEDGTIVDEKVK